MYFVGSGSIRVRLGESLSPKNPGFQICDGSWNMFPDRIEHGAGGRGRPSLFNGIYMHGGGAGL